MNYARTVRDGSARDDMLKRRSGAVRDAAATPSKPKPDSAPPGEQKAEDKPGV